MKKFLSLVTAIVMTVSLCIMPVYAQTYEEAAADAQNAEINYNRSVPLEVKGNKIVKQGTDEMVVLHGVNVPSMDWVHCSSMAVLLRWTHRQRVQKVLLIQTVRL